MRNGILEAPFIQEMGGHQEETLTAVSQVFAKDLERRVVNLPLTSRSP